ncbi:acyltransferase domain-containing protein, partial [Streptomyces sp. SID625]|nr:acyltransferase domain-containing protein [Streptomyces sp. SID625]
AAGIGGLIKMTEAIRHGTLPRTLHVTEPTTHVDWNDGAVTLLTEARPWPDTGRPRRAAVSSFGISGTNAHVIIEEPPAPDPRPAPESLPATPWVLSGRTPQALQDQAERLHRHLTRTPGWHASDIGLSLAATRTHFEHRAVVTAADPDALLDHLTRVKADEAAPAPAGRGRDKVVLVFPGQGSQWTGMASELLDQSPQFAASMARCERALAAHTDWNLTDVVRGAPGAPGLDRVDVVQPVLFAVMVSLAETWRTLGVAPSAVVGHSQGEIAAARVAGALSLDDAARIVALRSRALHSITGRGGMLS